MRLSTLILLLALGPLPLGALAAAAQPVPAGDALPEMEDAGDSLPAVEAARPELAAYFQDVRARRIQAGQWLAQARQALAIQSDGREQGGEDWWDVLGRQRRAMALRRLRERRERLEAQRDAYLALLREERAYGLALKPACLAGEAAACEALRTFEQEHPGPAGKGARQGH